MLPEAKAEMQGYDFNGFVDRYDESLLAMTLILNLPLEDGLYVALTRADRRDIFLARKSERKNHSSLDAYIQNSLGGGVAFYRQLKRYQQLQKLLQEVLCPPAEFPAVRSTQEIIDKAYACVERYAPRLGSLVSMAGSNLDQSIERIKTKVLKRKGSTYLSMLQQQAEVDEFECIQQHIVPERTVIITSSSSSAVHQRVGGYNVFDRSTGGLPLWFFHENSWESAHGRHGVAPNDLAHVTCSTDVFKAEQWLWLALEENGVLDQFYSFAGQMEPCDQPLKFKSGKLLVRKIAAIAHALSTIRKDHFIIWLDTDVLMDRVPDTIFYTFVRQYDISFIPFTTNLQYGTNPSVNFSGLNSSFWRIESGITVYKKTVPTLKILDDTLKLYKGLLLQLVRYCLTMSTDADHMCQAPWFRRNVYMDDIFALSLVLHKYKDKARFGWFSIGCRPECPEYMLCERARLPINRKYPFSHVCQAQTPYTSAFNLELYFIHSIGSGAYSNSFRSSFSKSMVDPELQFAVHQRFNDTLELRFFRASERSYKKLTQLQDEFWSPRAMRRRQTNGRWPSDAFLDLPSNPRLPTSFLPKNSTYDLSEIFSRTRTPHEYKSHILKLITEFFFF